MDLYKNCGRCIVWLVCWTSITKSRFNPRGLLTVYMTGRVLWTFVLQTPQKYMSLKFYTPQNTWHQNFQPKKIARLKVHMTAKQQDSFCSPFEFDYWFQV